VPWAVGTAGFIQNWLGSFRSESQRLYRSLLCGHRLVNTPVMEANLSAEFVFEKRHVRFNVSHPWAAIFFGLAANTRSSSGPDLISRPLRDAVIQLWLFDAIFKGMKIFIAAAARALALGQPPVCSRTGKRVSGSGEHELKVAEAILKSCNQRN